MQRGLDVLPDEIRAQLEDFVPGSDDFDANTAEDSPSLLQASLPNFLNLPSGWYWVPDNAPGEQWVANDTLSPRQIGVMYATKGGALYEEILPGSNDYRILKSWDEWDNVTTYQYMLVPAIPSIRTTLASVRNDLIEQRFSWTGSASSLILDVDTYLYAPGSSAAPTLVPEWRTTYTFSASGSFLLSVEGPTTEYVASPTSSSNYLHDLSQRTSNRLKRVLTYGSYQVGSAFYSLLEREHYERPNGGQDLAYSVTYRLSSGRWWPNTITDSFGTQRQIGITTNSYSGWTITLSDSHAVSISILDACNRTREHRLRSLVDPRNGDSMGPPTPNEEKHQYTYAFPGVCSNNQLSSLILPSGLRFEWDYDRMSGALLEKRFPNPNGSSTPARIVFSVGNFFDGANLESATNAVGTITTLRYTWMRRSNPWGIGLKPMSQTTTITGVNTVEGPQQTITSRFDFEPDGRIRRQRINSVVTEFGFEGDQGLPVGSGRKLLMYAIAGPEQDGRVALGSPETTFARIERDSSSPGAILRGAVKAVLAGPPGQERRVDYSYDAAGRLSAVRRTRGPGMPPSEVLFDYDWFGFTAVSRFRNLDNNGLIPASANGNRTGAAYIRKDSIVGPGGRIIAEVENSGPLYAPTPASFNPTDYSGVIYTYDPFTGLVSTTTDLIGRQTRVTYDVYGNPYTYELRIGANNLTTKKYFYDLAGLSVSAEVTRESPGGGFDWALTSVERNHAGKGYPWRIHLEEGAVLELSLNSAGQVAEESLDIQGQRYLHYTYEHDGIGRVIRSFVQTTGNAARTMDHQILYNEYSQVRKEWNAARDITEYQYDSAQRLKAVLRGTLRTRYERNPNTNDIARAFTQLAPNHEQLSEYQYNGAGELVEIADRGTNYNQPARVERYRYNSLGVMESGTAVDGTPWESSEGPDGFVWWARSGSAGNTILRVASRSVDPANKLILVSNISVGGQSLTAAFGYGGELRAAQRPGLTPVLYQYDRAYRLQSVTDQLGTTILYERDSLGRASKMRVTPSSTSSMLPIVREVLQRGLFGRVESIAETVGTQRVEQHWVYDSHGAISDETINYPWGLGARHASLDRINPETNAYDLRGRIHGVTVDGITSRPTYNSDGAITAVALSGAPAGVDSQPLGMTYNGLVPDTISVGNGLLRSTIQYGDFGELESSVTTRASSIVDEFHLVRGSSGQITQQQRRDFQGFGDAYKYDGRGRLTEWKKGVSSQAEFSNPFASISSAISGQLTFQGTTLQRLSRNETASSGPGLLNYTPNNAAERTAQINSQTLQYNARGDRTQDNFVGVQYEFDALGRVASIRNAAGQPIRSFAFDATGRLAAEMDGNGTKKIHRYVGMSRVAEDDGGSTSKLIVSYPYKSDEVLAYYRPEGGSWKGYYITTQPNGPSQLHDATGKVEEYAFSRDGTPSVRRQSNGQVRQGSHFGNNQLFKFMLFDEGSGDYFVRARRYNPQSGSFISQDALWAGDDTPYTAFAEDPVRHDDATGLQPEREQIIRVIVGQIDQSTLGTTERGMTAAVKDLLQRGQTVGVEGTNVFLSKSNPEYIKLMAARIAAETNSAGCGFTLVDPADNLFGPLGRGGGRYPGVWGCIEAQAVSQRISNDIPVLVGRSVGVRNLPPVDWIGLNPRYAPTSSFAGSLTSAGGTSGALRVQLNPCREACQPVFNNFDELIKTLQNSGIAARTGGVKIDIAAESLSERCWQTTGRHIVTPEGVRWAPTGGTMLKGIGGGAVAGMGTGALTYYVMDANGFSPEASHFTSAGVGYVAGTTVFAWVAGAPVVITLFNPVGLGVAALATIGTSPTALERGCISATIIDFFISGFSGQPPYWMRQEFDRALNSRFNGGI